MGSVGCEYLYGVGCVVRTGLEATSVRAMVPKRVMYDWGAAINTRGTQIASGAVWTTRCSADGTLTHSITSLEAIHMHTSVFVRKGCTHDGGMIGVGVASWAAVVLATTPPTKTVWTLPSNGPRCPLLSHCERHPPSRTATRPVGARGLEATTMHGVGDWGAAHYNGTRVAVSDGNLIRRCAGLETTTVQNVGYWGAAHYGEARFVVSGRDRRHWCAAER